MAIYLRKVNKNRWHPREEYEDCEEGDTPPEPLTDLRILDNKLSVWKIEDVEADEESEVNRSPLFRRIIAILAAMVKVSVSDIFYILISDSTLYDLGIVPEKSQGGSQDKEANKEWHYNLHISSAQRLIELTETMIGEPRIVYKQDTKDYLQESIDAEWLKANRSIKIELGIIKPGDCPECGKPLWNCSNPNCAKPIQID